MRPERGLEDECEVCGAEEGERCTTESGARVSPHKLPAQTIKVHFGERTIDVADASPSRRVG